MTKTLPLSFQKWRDEAVGERDQDGDQAPGYEEIKGGLIVLETLRRVISRERIFESRHFKLI